ERCRRIGRTARLHARRARGVENAARALDATLRTIVASGPKRGARPERDSAETARARALAAPFYDRGLARLRAGDADAAVEPLEVAASVDPEHAPTVLAIGESASAHNLASAAERLMIAAAQSSTSPTKTLLALARHHAANNDPMLAKRTLRCGLA